MQKKWTEGAAEGAELIRILRNEADKTLTTSIDLKATL